MAEPKIDINITTTANTAGAQAAAAAVQAATQATQQGAAAATQAAGAQTQQTAATQGATTAATAAAGAQTQQAAATRQAAAAATQAAAAQNQQTAATQAAMRNAPAAAQGMNQTAQGTRNAGMATLQFSQALEDSQYGLAGVMNNIPGLVMSLGGSAGLAGAISVSMVLMNQLQKQLSKLDFDGTWIGDVGDAVKEMVTGVSEAERELREIANAPNRWATTGADAVEAYSKAVTKALEAEITLLRQRNSEMERAATHREAEMAHATKMTLMRLRAIETEGEGSESWVTKETAINNETLKGRVQARAEPMNQAKRDEAAANETARKEKEQADAAEKRLKDLERRDEIQRQIADMQAENISQKKEMDRKAGERGAAGGTAYNTPEEEQQFKQATENRNRRIAKLQQEQNSLPGIVEGETPQSIQANAEAQRKEAEAAAETAAKARAAREDAEKEAARGIAEAKEEYTLRQEEIERARAKRQKEAEKAERDQRRKWEDEDFESSGDKVIDLAKKKETALRRHDEDVMTDSEQWGKMNPDQRNLRVEEKRRERARIEKEYDAKIAAEEQAQRQQEEDAKNAPGPPDVAGAQAGLGNMARNGVDGGARPPEYTEGLRALSAAVGDGQGDTGAEMRVIQEMRDSIENGSANKAEALQRALRAMEKLQDDGSKMEGQLIATLRTYGGKLGSLAAALAEQAARISAIEINTTRR